jgi:hypothetical protein
MAVPDDPLEEEPVSSRSVPDEPASVVPVLTSTPPLTADAAVEVDGELAINTDPDNPVDAVPELIKTEPPDVEPFTLPPLPAIRAMSPPFPALLAPPLMERGFAFWAEIEESKPTDTAPAKPDEDAPLSRAMKPESFRETPVATLREPLESLEDSPEVIETFPVLSDAEPELNSRSPDLDPDEIPEKRRIAPVALALCPVEITASPEIPAVEEPEDTSIAPVAP